jgi:hypothetical protein
LSSPQRGQRSWKERLFDILVVGLIVGVVSGVISGYVVFYQTSAPHVSSFTYSYHEPITSTSNKTDYYYIDIEILNSGLTTENNLTVYFPTPVGVRIVNYSVSPNIRDCYLKYGDPTISGIFRYTNCPLPPSSPLTIQLGMVGPPTAVSVGCSATIGLGAPVSTTSGNGCSQTITPLFTLTIIGQTSGYRQITQPTFGTRSEFG